MWDILFSSGLKLIHSHTWGCKKKVNIQPKYTELCFESAFSDFPESHNTHTVRHKPKSIRGRIITFVKIAQHLISRLSWVSIFQMFCILWIHENECMSIYYNSLNLQMIKSTCMLHARDQLQAHQQKHTVEPRITPPRHARLLTQSVWIQNKATFRFIILSCVTQALGRREMLCLGFQSLEKS